MCKNGVMQNHHPTSVSTGLEKTVAVFFELQDPFQTQPSRSHPIRFSPYLMGLFGDCLITQAYKTIKALHPSFVSVRITVSQSVSIMSEIVGTHTERFHTGFYLMVTQCSNVTLTSAKPALTKFWCVLNRTRVSQFIAYVF